MSTNSTKTIKGRISNKHGTEEHWYIAGTAEKPFCPLEGELIVYDPDEFYAYPRTKYGARDVDGNLIPVHLLPFTYETLLLNIVYEDILDGFDPTEIIIETTTKTAVLGKAILGTVVLG